MTTPTPTDDPRALLDLPAGLAVRHIARAFIDEARAAAERLDDPEDAESLHDFRVAIRRLRATLRAWGKALRPEISKADRKKLSKVQGATGDGRDAEVMLAWVEGQRDALPKKARAGQARLADELSKRKDAAYDKARGEVREAFAAVGDDLRARLSRMTRVVDIDRPHPEPSYAAALADAVEAQMSCLDDRVRTAVRDDDAEGLHTARIDTKRLRYLIEPVRKGGVGATALVKRCKELQDVLGEFQDASVLEAELDRHDSGAAVDALTALNTERAERLFGEVRTHWIGGALAGLQEAVVGFAAGLRNRGEAAVPVEIERKYLLSALPPAAKEGERVALEQGYLPGERLIERVRRVETAHGVTHHRTVKVGKGVRRIELEERCDAAVWETLWSLTEGCRVRKVRYAVPDGELMWEIDAFTDRELFLAEVELPHEDTAVSFPDWLAEYVVREVTDEGEFTNRRLAK